MWLAMAATGIINRFNAPSWSRDRRSTDRPGRLAQTNLRRRFDLGSTPEADRAITMTPATSTAPSWLTAPAPAEDTPPCADRMSLSQNWTTMYKNGESITATNIYGTPPQRRISPNPQLVSEGRPIWRWYTSNCAKSAINWNTRLTMKSSSPKPTLKPPKKA